MRDVPERAWAYDDFTAAEEPPAADLAAGLPSLPVISAALRRRAWLWCATAVAGLLIGLGVCLVLPPAYQASTSILLTPNPGEQAGEAMPNDVALLQSRTVAELAMHKLGLRQSVDSFLAAYTVTTVTDRVLLLTVSAPSSDEAVRRANALATEFLQFRAAQLQAEQQLVLAALNQQINQDEQQVESIASQITNVSAQAKSPAQQAELEQSAGRARPGEQRADRAGAGQRGLPGRPRSSPGVDGAGQRGTRRCRTASALGPPEAGHGLRRRGAYAGALR